MKPEKLATGAHLIRLRGPWVLEPLWEVQQNESGQAKLIDCPPQQSKQHLPNDWRELLGQQFRGTVRYRRRFGCPTNLELDEEVWLVCDEVSGVASWSLNGQTLPVVQHHPEINPAERYLITKLLQERNEIIVDVSCGFQVSDLNFKETHITLLDATGPCGLVGEVRLEIGKPL